MDQSDDIIMGLRPKYQHSCFHLGRWMIGPFGPRQQMGPQVVAEGSMSPEKDPGWTPDWACPKYAPAPPASEVRCAVA